jgi:hypothetical protein
MRGKQVPKICTAFVSLALLAVLWAPRASAQSSTGNNFAVSGNGPQQNLFLLNGVEYTGAAENNMQPGGTSQQLLGGDAVREFNVLRDTYSAEYGKHPGRQVVIVTQSGSNQLHGNVFEFLRNNDLDSPNFFDQGSAPSFQRNQFGGSLGGPIQADKTLRVQDAGLVAEMGRSMLRPYSGH